MIARSAAAALSVVLAAALVLSCRTGTPPPPEPLASGDPRPGELLAALGDRADALVSARGTARLAVDGPGGSIRSKQVLVAQRPASLRIEILGFLNQAQALLVTDGERYQLFDTREYTFEEGPVGPDLLWQVAGIQLTPEEAIDVVLGVPPVSQDWETAMAYRFADGRILLGLVDERGLPRQSLEFDEDGVLLGVEQRTPMGSTDWIARYSDYEERDGWALARNVELQFPASDVTARLSLGSMELNPEIAEGTFHLQIPPGVRYKEGQGG